MWRPSGFLNQFWATSILNDFVDACFDRFGIEFGWIVDGFGGLLGEHFGQFELLKHVVSCTRNNHFGCPGPPKINKNIDQLQSVNSKQLRDQLFAGFCYFWDAFWEPRIPK